MSVDAIDQAPAEGGPTTVIREIALWVGLLTNVALLALLLCWMFPKRSAWLVGTLLAIPCIPFWLAWAYWRRWRRRT